MDANKLQQVFVNLMMNAAQAMPNGGTLTLKSYVFTINDKAMLKRDSSGEFRMGETVLGVEFLDTGPGIRSEDLEQLFDPFFSTREGRRKSDSDSLFDERIATFEEDEGAYNQQDAEGFIRLNALRLRTGARQKHRDRRRQ